CTLRYQSASPMVGATPRPTRRDPSEAVSLRGRKLPRMPPRSTALPGEADSQDSAGGRVASRPPAVATKGGRAASVGRTDRVTEGTLTTYRASDRGDAPMKRSALSASVLGVLGVWAIGCAHQPVESQRSASTPSAASRPVESQQSAAAPAAAPAGTGTGYGLVAANVDYLAPAGAAPLGLPSSAKPGECYVQAVVPAQYEAVKERVLKKAAATRIEVVPAQLQEVEEQVMVRAATKRLEVVPATFEEIEEQVMVR